MQNNIKFSIFGFVVWLLCALFFLYEFLLRTVIGTFQHPIMYDLELSSFKFSILSSTTYLLIYGLMQLPVGFIVDRIGLKKSVLIGVVVCAISSIAFAYVSSYPLAIACRLLMGFGSAFGFICLLVAVYDWMPHRYVGIFIGLSVFIGTMGPMLAAGPLEAISQTSDIDWRAVFTALGIFGVFLSALVLFFVRNNHQQAGSYVILRRPEPLSASIWRLFMRAQPWSIAIFSAATYFTIEYLSENEGKSFLIFKGFSPSFASYMLSLSWLAFAISCPLLGFLSDYFLRRRLIMIFGALFNVIAIILISFAVTKSYIIFAFIILGIGASSQTIGFATIAEQFKPQYLAIGLALNNALIMIVIALNAPLIGLLIDHAGYETSFLVIVGIGLVGLAAAIWGVKETFCKSQADFTYLQSKTAVA